MRLGRSLPFLVTLVAGCSGAPTGQPVDILITGGTIVTMDSARRVLEDGAVAISGDRIIAVGPTAELEARYAATQTIDAHRKIVMPGLIDGHGHAGHGLVKSLGMDTDEWYPATETIYARGSTVDFWRAEALLTRQWTFAGGLSLQTTLGGEYSRIRQTSAGGLSRSFLRPKGGVSLAWAIDPRWSLNASIERRVGQLSFFDFSAAIDLNNGVASAANVSLVPEQTWRTEAEIVRSLGSAGSLTLGGYHEWISDIVDRIPINATEEGIGNLPQARRWAFTGRGTVLLDSIGWHGGRINASGEFRRSQVRDPLTGENRRISGDLIRRWSIDFRHDVPRSALAWGWSLSQERTAPIFRLDQFSDTFLTQPIATVFVEHKDVGGLTVRLALRNVLDGRDELTRTYYVDRRNGPVDLQEFQIRNIHLIGVLTISGAF